MAASTGERSVVCRKNLGAVPDTAGFWRRALGAITAVPVVVMIVAGVIVLPEAAYAETCLLDSGSGSAPVSDLFACGNSASASAPDSTAVGNHTDAAGAYSVAVGFLSNASQSHAVAVGATSNASGRDRRRWATAARRQHRRLPPSAPSAAQPPSKPRLRWFEHGERTQSSAFGASSTASGVGTVAIGYAATASGDYAIALGRQARQRCRIRWQSETAPRQSG